MSLITRFAPSPTGNLHIGSARTALFNWLYAKHHKGKFLLRIEDTDEKRSSEKFTNAILEGLSWLGLNHDEEIIFQSKRTDRYIELAHKLLSLEKAYYCYCNNKTNSEFYQRKNSLLNSNSCTCQNLKKGSKFSAPAVIKFKIPKSSQISFVDQIYGEIIVSTEQISDIVILRSDNTPTYNLAVVVDDYDMGITNIIRGNDHLANTPKQLLIYQALNWQLPNFAHIPLIHDETGQKLSKRYGAKSISDYRFLGILPEAMCNYLLRMGWSHGNSEIIEMTQAIEWFTVKNIGLSPARLNHKKLEYLNNHYINKTENIKLLNMILPIIEKKLGYSVEKKDYLLKGLSELKKRAFNLVELADLSLFYVEKVPITINDEAYGVILSNIDIIQIINKELSKIIINDWNKDTILNTVKELAKNNNIEINNIYHTLRATITGRMNAPSIIEIMNIIGKDESLKRIRLAELRSL